MRKNYIEPVNIERKFRRLARLGQELKIPVLETFLEMEVTLPDGKVIHSHMQRSHSWVRNAYNVAVVMLAGVSPNGGGIYQAGAINMKMTNGSVVNEALLQSASIDQLTVVDIENGAYGYRGAAGDNSYGIQVGTGNNPESFENYCLQTLVSHGNGAGQLSYSAGEVPVESYDAPSKTYTVQHMRFLNNNSGGDITIAEVGLVSRGSGGTYKKLLSRDVLTPAVVVTNTGQLKVTYTFSLVFPA